jgi:aromatic-L-amino-acid/L-tryptophan decarboxylase
MTDAPTHPTFAWDEAAMRRLGYRVVDMILEHHLHLVDKPVTRRQPRAHYDSIFAEAPPRKGSNPDSVLDLVATHIMTGLGHTDHPRFYGYVPSPGNYLSALADTLAAGFNVFAGQTLVGSPASAIEAITLGWLRDLVGFPASTGGIFLSGGSMAGLTALHTARVAALDGPGHDPTLRVYATSEAHSSLSKALRILGFATQQWREVASEADLTLDVTALAAAIAADRAQGLRPFAVIATAGTTSTGTVDPLPAIRRVCDTHGLWLHVDGAFGAAAVLDANGRKTLAGIELADSLVLDPHKWWFQPYEIGAVLIRDGSRLQQAFNVDAGYLREANALSSGQGGLDGDITFFNLGPQMTRSFRALKLWMFIKTFGLDAISTAVSRSIALAEHVERHIDADRRWEIVTRAQLGVLTFRSRRHNEQGEATVRAAVAAMLADGFALITTTEVRGEVVLRLCLIHPDAQLHDVIASLELMARFLEQVVA